MNIRLEQGYDHTEGYMSLEQLKQLVSFMEDGKHEEIAVNWGDRNMRICGPGQPIDLPSGPSMAYPILLSVHNNKIG